MPNGGYVKENGISVCTDCHILCEEAAEYSRKLYHNDGSSEIAQGLEPECTCGKDPCVCDEPPEWAGYEPELLYDIIGSSLEAATVASEGLSEGA